ncbi:MAG TPA: lyase [Methylomirabilota bacterium]|jgi:virginiamycin B lyase
MRHSPLRFVLISLVLPLAAWAWPAAAEVAVQAYALPPGGGPHDVAVGIDGIVWYTAQRSGQLGRLDAASGKVDLISLGPAAAPHGVIIGPDGAPWVTEGGTNSIVRVDPRTREVARWSLPEGRGYVNLNTATFDKRGRIWFTGQNGVYGRLDPASGTMQVWDAPRGRGPYGIATTPGGDVYYASLAGSHIARVDLDTGAATIIEPPTKGQGARRVWSDSRGRIWVSEWNSGNVSRYDPQTKEWKAWKLPGDSPRAYAVYVDERDKVWLSEWSANAMVRFDPETEKFEAFPSDRPGANVRQILGRPGEVWAPESGTDRLVVYRTK